MLRIYDYFEKHRLVMVLLLCALFALCVLMGLRLKYKENVADFLPVDEENARYNEIYNALGNQNRTTLLFSIDDESEPLDAMEREDLLMEAAETFEILAEDYLPDSLPLQCRVDDSQVFGAMDFIVVHTPLFLTEADYRRADSLLDQDGYVEASVANVGQMLSQPMGSMATDAIAADPLNLFSPALQRLQALGGLGGYQVVDEYLFDEEGAHLFAFLSTPYESTDTKAYTLLSDQLESLFDSLRNEFPQVRVTAVGAGLIAATNASQIKHDSILAIVLAVVLIAIILGIGVARKQNIVWLGLSILFGWLFALAVIVLFRPEISIIVIGIGSVLVGIAVNYPLHYIDHIKDHPERRMAIGEMIEPLVVGNVTTVSAFACLLFVRAEAMRDLGLFGALMLVGTIVFVMLFLPHLAKGGRGQKTPMPIAVGRFSEPKWMRSPLLFLILVAMTVLFAVMSEKTSFDDNLSHINYMTAQQRDDLALMSRSIEDDSTTDMLYVVAQGKTVEEALEQNAPLADDTMTGLGSLLPDRAKQEKRLDMWNAFLARHTGLAAEVKRTARQQGFTAEAFEPFYARLDGTYTTLSVSEMDPITALASDYILTCDTAIYLVNFLRLPTTEAAAVKAKLRQESSLLVFDQSDVGSQLVSALSDDFNYILYVCGFVVFFFLCLSFRSFELSLLAFLPLTVGWIWILGIMGIFDIRFNIVNIILATFIFGQGDDYTIFITEGLVKEYAYGKERLQGFRKSVILSGVLMFVGIGTLIFAKHPAMRSLAEVAIIGMAVVVLMACYLPPVIFRWMTVHRGKKRLVPVTLRRLWRTFVSLLVFVLFAFVIFTPFTWIYRMMGRDSEKKRLRFHRIICSLNRAAMKALPGVKYRLVNRVGESFEKPAVIISNHQSHLDLICMLMLDPKIVVITNDWVWKNPVYGAIIRYAEYYPASRGYETNLPELRHLVERGYSIVIFPEGTRSVDGSVGRFHKGAFALAADLGVELLPVYLHGTGAVMPKEDIILRQGTITVEVGERISVEGDALSNARAMRSHFQTHYDSMCRQYEDESFWKPFLDAQYYYKGRSISQRKPAYEAMLQALAHQDQQVDLCLSQEDALFVEHCALRPWNLLLQVEGANKPTTVVIGGGMGGLITGALLAKTGRQVTVLEKNTIVGGGLQCFKHNGATFATGLHVFGGFEEGGVLRKIFEYLGVCDKLNLKPTDADNQDEVVFLSENQEYHLPCGRDSFTAALIRYFPQESEGIVRFVDKMYQLVDAELETIKSLKDNQEVPPLGNDAKSIPLAQVLSETIQDNRLRQLLCYINPLYSGLQDTTPAYLHALVLVQHINGSFQFVGGSQQLADALAEVIVKGGGKVLNRQQVRSVVVENHRVKEVTTADGSHFSADAFVSDIHPTLLFPMVEGKGFTPSFVNRISQTPNTDSSFTLFLQFKPESFPYINHAVYLFDSADSVWQHGTNEDDLWPSGFMFVTPPVENQGKWANTMIVHCPMPFEWVRQWSESRVGHRGEAYLAWKKQKEERVVAQLERRYPQIRTAIRDCFSASPLTIRDYYANPNGCLYGLRKESTTMISSSMSVRTKVENLYLTGQNVHLHGLFGVSMTAVETVYAMRNMMKNKK